MFQHFSRDERVVIAVALRMLMHATANEMNTATYESQIFLREKMVTINSLLERLGV
jgi:hypothetical protein